jgi:hypothetical protein
MTTDAPSAAPDLSTQAQAIWNEPWHANESEADRSERVAQLYKQQYPPKPEQTGAAPPSVSESRTSRQSDAARSPADIRAAMERVNEGSARYAELAAELEAHYRTTYGAGDHITLPPPPEGKSWDTAVISELREWGRESGLSTAELEQGLTDYAGTGGRMSAAERDARAMEAAEILEREWGDKFEQRLAHAQRFFQRHVPKNIQRYIDEAGLAENVVLIRRFAALGEGR